MEIIKRHQFSLIIIYLLFFLALGIGYTRSPQLQTTINQAAENVADSGIRVFDKLTGQKVAIKSAHHAKEKNQQTSNKADTNETSNVQTKSNGGGRWQSRHATVYVAIKDKSLRQSAIEAMHNWNKTGAFTFKQIKSKKKANVIVSESNADDGAAGMTKSELNATTGYFIKVYVSLNGNYLLNPIYNYSHERVVNTAEHELGHAIGLEHTNSASVMQPAGSFYSIQPADVRAVRYIYNHRPSPNTNTDNGGIYNQSSSSSDSGLTNQNSQSQGN